MIRIAYALSFAAGYLFGMVEFAWKRIKAMLRC
jgi:hypothetical protein